MSKKIAKSTIDQSTTADPVSAPKRRGREPMTDAQRQSAKIKRDFKRLSGTEEFSDPALWSTLDPAVVAKVERMLVHVRTVIHASERDALKARLAALDAADSSTPAPVPAPQA